MCTQSMTEEMQADAQVSQAPSHRLTAFVQPLLIWLKVVNWLKVRTKVSVESLCVRIFGPKTMGRRFNTISNSWLTGELSASLPGRQATPAVSELFDQAYLAYCSAPEVRLAHRSVGAITSGRVDRQRPLVLLVNEQEGLFATSHP